MAGTKTSELPVLADALTDDDYLIVLRFDDPGYTLMRRRFDLVVADIEAEIFSDLPTEEPVEAGRPWVDAGVVKVSD